MNFDSFEQKSDLLNLHEDYKQLIKEICVGLQVPKEYLEGTYSSSSVYYDLWQRKNDKHR